ncbi:MAG: DUF1572 family protein [Phycisphaeraceae bacterium]|nr:DUF1572 family protein [Phycisphaeraceae bacterium]
MSTRLTIIAFEAEFRRYRKLSEGAIEQLSWDQLRQSLDKETNSIAVIMKHVGGNLRSRWTDALTTDGEKPWRNRDTEFIDDFADRAALMATWNAGWSVVQSQLATFTDEDLSRTLTIRGEPHTLALALTRSVSHTAYHAGQIVQISRVLASRAGIEWKTLTVARGKSAVYNTQMGYNADAPPR